jgi:amino acid transporter
MAATTRLPFALGVNRHFPTVFAKLHPRWRTPHVSILTQAGLGTLLLLIAQLGETLRTGYQILVDMVVLATLIPFIYIFASGFKFGHRWAGASGGLIAAAGVILSISPPPGVSSVGLFELKVLGGTLLLALLGHVTFQRSKAAHA